MFFRQRPAENASLSYFFGCTGKHRSVAVDVVAGLSGKPASTLAFERRWNPMLSMSREAFVEALVAEIPPPPQDMARILADNLRGDAAQLPS